MMNYRLRGSLAARHFFCQLAYHVAVALIFLGAMTSYAASQTFTVLHSFSGLDGQEPLTGLTMDSAGNLYGTTYYGGPAGAGTIFKLTHKSGGWIFSSLYSFQGGDDGAHPQGRVAIGPNGTLYGTTLQGGGRGCYTLGCGTVFNLRLPPAVCKSVQCPWKETILHRFADFGMGDGDDPIGDLTFDSAGNFYGATAAGGSGEGFNGAVYEMAASGGGWSESVIYSFTSAGGMVPAGGVIFDKSGNLYGTTNQGGAHQYGTIYRLVPSSGGWTQSVLYSLQGNSDGYYTADLILDGAGNLYGANFDGGPNGGGTAYQLAPSGGGWSYNLMYGFSGQGFGGQLGGSLVMDKEGNVYGATVYGGSKNAGTIFKLTPSGGGWTQSTIHDFTVLSEEGYYPNGSLVIDANGNIYGTTQVGGSGNPGSGTVFMITP